MRSRKLILPDLFINCPEFKCTVTSALPILLLPDNRPNISLRLKIERIYPGGEAAWGNTCKKKRRSNVPSKNSAQQELIVVVNLFVSRLGIVPVQPKTNWVMGNGRGSNKDHRKLREMESCTQDEVCEFFRKTARKLLYGEAAMLISRIACGEFLYIGVDTCSPLTSKSKMNTAIF